MPARRLLPLILAVLALVAPLQASAASATLGASAPAESGCASSTSSCCCSPDEPQPTAPGVRSAPCPCAAPADAPLPWPSEDRGLVPAEPRLQTSEPGHVRPGAEVVLRPVAQLAPRLVRPRLPARVALGVRLL